LIDGIVPRDNEDAAHQIGVSWNQAADALLACIAEGEKGANAVASAWLDVAGQRYNQQIIRTGGGDGQSQGLQQLVAMMRELARQAEAYAAAVEYVKLREREATHRYFARDFP